MADAAEACPHCGRQGVDPARQDVGDGLLVCDGCGELFARRAGARRRDTIDALYRREGPGAPAARPTPAGNKLEPRAPTGGRRTGLLATLVWAAGTLLLLLLLAGQAVWTMRDALAQREPLRPLLTTFCEHTGCDVPLLRAPERIQMTARDIRRHPVEDDALRISITFTNRSDFPQRWPDIRLVFHDLADRPLARRIFVPAEYLPANLDEADGMPARGALQTLLEIVDPGPEAVNFTFAFH